MTYNEAREQNLLYKEAADAEREVRRLTGLMKVARNNGWNEIAERYAKRIKAI